MSIPSMDYAAAESRDRARLAVRAFHNAKVVETFRFHGLSLADMDRAELLGVISFLATNGAYLKTVKITDTDL